MADPPATDDEQDLTLADGRTLCYLDLGDPAGVPLLWCHGGLSSNLDVRPAQDAARAQGVRLLAPNRPGVGRSSRHPDRPMAGWADDVAELLDQLDLERVAVMGWSLGGGFAQAVAAAWPDRVSSLTLVASVIPPTWPGMAHEVNRMDRLFMGLDGRAAAIDVALFRGMRALADHRPARFARLAHLPAADAEAVTDAMVEGLRQPDGVVDEYRAMSADWGFEPEDISAPAAVWQGDADDLVPPSWGRRLAEVITGSELHPVAGGTHFLAFDHWGDLLGPVASSD